ncbi:MAG: hypothetical protein H6672_13015 [Anaerolineaceae bacterium]|nr:hypothetical protein [Anaerolineaceae bacterium]
MSNTNGAVSQGEEVTQEIRDDLKEVGREIRQRANDVKDEVVKQLYGAAETIRKEAKESHLEGDGKAAAHEVAKGLEKAANYLHSRSVEKMGDDATRVVRRNPMRAVMTALIVGLILGVLLKGGDKK